MKADAPVIFLQRYVEVESVRALLEACHAAA